MAEPYKTTSIVDILKWHPGYRFIRDLFPSDPALPARPPLGVLGQQAADQQARVFRQIANQQLAQNIANINREWGTAGRYASGMRLGAIQRGIGDINTAWANAAAGNQMDLYKTNLAAELALRQMEEERMWRQAQLDTQSSEDDTYSQFGAILPYLLAM